MAIRTKDSFLMLAVPASMRAHSRENKCATWASVYGIDCAIVVNAVFVTSGYEGSWFVDSNYCSRQSWCIICYFEI